MTYRQTDGRQTVTLRLPLDTVGGDWKPRPCTTFGRDHTFGSGDMLAVIHTDTHTHTQTCTLQYLPSLSRPNYAICRSVTPTVDRCLRRYSAGADTVSACRRSRYRPPGEPPCTPLDILTWDKLIYLTGVTPTWRALYVRVNHGVADQSRLVGMATCVLRPIRSRMSLYSGFYTTAVVRRL